MNVLVVVNHARDWPFEHRRRARRHGARISDRSARTPKTMSARVMNLCRTDRYQGRGYYVSLLAEARGHRPLPEVKTIGDLQAGTSTSCSATPFIDASAARARRLQRDHLRRRRIVRPRPGATQRSRWRSSCSRLCGSRFCMRSSSATTAAGAFASVRITERRTISRRTSTGCSSRRRPSTCVAARGHARREPPPAAPAIAILFDDDEPDPPSNAAALEKFTRRRRSARHASAFIGRDDIERLDEFDALFIRDTTNVNHYTYQFARRAAAAGLVVIDDPDSILKCTNKVYLNELLSRHQVPVPKTLMVHRDNVDQIVPALGLPCILKQPDSAFSLGVTKVESRAALRDRARARCSRNRNWSSRRNGCRRRSTGASASSTGGRSTCASTSWRRDTGRSSSASRGASSKDQRSRCRSARRPRSWYAPRFAPPT